MTDIYSFTTQLEQYFVSKKVSDVWVYSRTSVVGSLLIKNSGNDKIYLLKSSDSLHPIGASRIEKFINRTDRFKGKTVNNYIYIAFGFRDNALRLSKVDKRVSVISLDYTKKAITIHGSMNIDLNILNHFVEFANHIQFSVTYDFEGLLTHQGFNNKSANISPVARIQERVKNPKIFFSYSWDNQSHKLWVLKLASDLIKSGIDVLIDEWDLDRYNNDLHLFMESGIRDSDKVIMVCTPGYATKANNRTGGVGVENTIITGEFYDKDKNNKYIPLARSYTNSLNECLPSYLKSKYCIDFQNEAEYKNKLDELIRKILNIPRFKKPQLGEIPNLQSNEL